MYSILGILRTRFEDFWEASTNLTVEIEAIKGLWPNEASVRPEECLKGWQELSSIVILNDSMCQDLLHGFGG